MRFVLQAAFDERRHHGHPELDTNQGTVWRCLRQFATVWQDCGWCCRTTGMCAQAWCQVKYGWGVCHGASPPVTHGVKKRTDSRQLVLPPIVLRQMMCDRATDLVFPLAEIDNAETTLAEYFLLDERLVVGLKRGISNLFNRICCADGMLVDGQDRLGLRLACHVGLSLGVRMRVY